MGILEPYGRIVQYAFTVPDLDEGIATHVEMFGIGPWFRMGPFSPGAALYRGRPTPGFTVSLARAFSGDSMVELIEQHDDGPSIYREVVDRRGHGFHHVAVATYAMDDELARHRARGRDVVFADVLPSGARIVYVDPGGDLPGFVELIEMNADQEKKFTRFADAARGWDGTDPVRVG